MNTRPRGPIVLMLLCSICVQTALGQTGAPPASDAAQSSEAPAAPAAPPPVAAAKGAQNEAGEPRVHDKELAKSGAPAADKRTDRVDLDTTTITGNRELPKVMYVVPWKKSDIGDLAGKPMNSLLDEVLAPVDRDVFRREVTYFHAVNGPAAQNSTPATPPPRQGEK
jgi:Tfp pilus assembly protein FimV